METITYHMKIFIHLIEILQIDGPLSINVNVWRSRKADNYLISLKGNCKYLNGDLIINKDT